MVLTGRPGESFAPGEVLIDGPAITHVGARGSAPEPPGTDVVELPGCRLMPGMIDSHVPIGFDRAVDPHTRRAASTPASGPTSSPSAAIPSPASMICESSSW